MAQVNVDDLPLPVFDDPREQKVFEIMKADVFPIGKATVGQLVKAIVKIVDACNKQSSPPEKEST